MTGGVIDDVEVMDLMNEIEGDREHWGLDADWIQQGLLEREETRARVVMSSLVNWDISPDVKKELEKWAEALATRALNRKAKD